MTIINEAVRLFFAISALVLVGLLSGPLESTKVQTAADEHQAAVEKETRLDTNKEMKIVDRKLDKKLARKSLAKKG